MTPLMCPMQEETSDPKTLMKPTIMYTNSLAYSLTVSVQVTATLTNLEP